MKILILCSGGLKAAALCALASRETQAENIHLLLINHQQKAFRKEKEAVQKLAAYYKITYSIICTNNNYSSAQWLSFKLSYYIFYSLMYAHHFNYHLLYYGSSKDDAKFNREASLKYLKQLQTLIKTIQGEKPLIEVEAPFILLNESQILELGESWNTPWYLTWSCEKENSMPCNECVHCKRKNKSIRHAKLSFSRFDKQPPEAAYSKR